jgi:hypothetical protein
VPTLLQAPGVECFRREQSIYAPAASRGHFNVRLFVCAGVVCAVELIKTSGSHRVTGTMSTGLARASRMLEPLSPTIAVNDGAKLEREPTNHPLTCDPASRGRRRVSMSVTASNAPSTKYAYG